MRLRTALLATACLVRHGPARAFALAATVDKLDDVPEALHTEYVKQGEVYVLQVTGMRPQAEFDTLQRSHNTEKQNHAALRTKFQTAFGDRKFEEIQADLDRIPELETAAEGKLDDEKINGIVEARVRTKLAPVERERDQLKTQLGERDQTIGELTGKEKRRKIRDDVRAAAKKAGVSDEAMDDALLLGDNVFELREDDGKTVVREGTGYTQGIEPSVLFTDLQAKKPHWFGPSSGGGAQGNRDAVRGGSNPWSKAGWNLTQQGKAMEADPAKAEQLAKTAGHKDAASANRADAK